MDMLACLGPDALLMVVSFAAGAEVVGLLQIDRRTRYALAGPASRKHFRAASVERWGGGCVLPGGDEADWFGFYLRRLGHRAPLASSLDLIQESYAQDAYRLLSCCILSSRTSGGDKVRKAISDFFEACPTPTSVLATDLPDLERILRPLGLRREVVIRRFAEGFLTRAWSDPAQLHGCGRFASDSWKIFCLGKRPKRYASLDRNLTAYCRFVEREMPSALDRRSDEQRRIERQGQVHAHHHRSQSKVIVRHERASKIR